ncbi:M48 family metallopeptidase, partial [Sandarakinorhabdus oryzae]|uniref:M48 family metallopeptidase n=1 Tax=Sandarakinorhabdus oryzae TaxID=2675220 RepID=UPI0012E19AFE
FYCFASRCLAAPISSASGRIEISLPARGGEAAAADLLASHHGWIVAQVAKWPEPIPFAPDAVFPLDGLPVRIDWQAQWPRTPMLAGSELRVGGPVSLLPGRIERWLKAQALADLEPATRRLADQLGRPVARVSVGDASSRWGSCAGARGGDGARVAYSWRLILAPAWVRFAIVAHEAAHLVHQDHSPAFHALNRQLDSRAQEARRWLARHGAALHWVGRHDDGSLKIP